MGAGTQCTHHRRPIYNMYDGAALALVKAGSGANLLGYYMFHGGSNPIGKLSTMQESKASHYPNDLPIISYDFYAPLSEWNQTRPSYKKLKILHYFFKDFGHLVVGNSTVYPNKVPNGIADLHTLKWVARSNGENGFIFFSNYQRHSDIEDVQNVQFHLILHDESSLIFPENPTIIAKNAIGIFPFNLIVDKIVIIYATTEPFCIIDDRPNHKTLVMIAFEGTDAEIVLANNSIQDISGTSTNITQREDKYQISIPQPSHEVEIKINLTDGNTFSIFVLTHSEALNAWKVKQHDQDFLFLTLGDLLITSESVKLQTTDNSLDLFVYPVGSALKFSEGLTIIKNSENVFDKYSLTFPRKAIDLEWQENVNMLSQLKNSIAPSRPLPPC